MSVTDSARCPNCRQLQERVDSLEGELAALKEVVAQLGRQLAAARKDSSNSSKPPSSDIVRPPKPPPPEGQDKRRIGGQPGHPKHERLAFPPQAPTRSCLSFRSPRRPPLSPYSRPCPLFPPHRGRHGRYSREDPCSAA